MQNKLILVIVLGVLILGGALLLNNKSNNSNTDTTTNTLPNENQNIAKPVEGKDVSVTANGFEPQTVTVKKGQRVVWANKSGGPVTVNSDSHPTHLKWPFLNLGTSDDGASVSVVFEKAGTYTYHNHLDTSQVGTVIVE